METRTTAPIWLHQRGVAWVDEMNTKVIEGALDMIAHGWSAAEICTQHPPLSLAQIHAALGYYDDHKAEIDAKVERSLRETDRFRAQADGSPIRARLRGMGRPR